MSAASRPVWRCAVPIPRPHLEGVEFMLVKGGQMGPDDLFDRLLTGN
jgi:hypothetical protein